MKTKTPTTPPCPQDFQTNADNEYIAAVNKIFNESMAKIMIQTKREREREIQMEEFKSHSKTRLFPSKKT